RRAGTGGREERRGAVRVLLSRVPGSIGLYVGASGHLASKHEAGGRTRAGTRGREWRRGATRNGWP
ncbi:hypothetical protein EXIGLDRAFT_730123, partial [Exidia glandulosa HHB12029]